MEKSWIGKAGWIGTIMGQGIMAIGRWHAVDPMVEMYYSESPYVYCVNNFVNKVDTTGCFSTKFGAWLYKLFNGGDQILKDVGGEYFVSTQIVHSDDEVELL